MPRQQNTLQKQGSSEHIITHFGAKQLEDLKIPLDILDTSRKSNNEPVPYPTTRHFVTEMYVHMCVHFCYKMVRYGICKVGILNTLEWHALKGWHQL